jgi:hypothetical protein
VSQIGYWENFQVICKMTLDKIIKGSEEAINIALKSGFERAATKYSKKDFLKG